MKADEEKVEAPNGKAIENHDKNWTNRIEKITDNLNDNNKCDAKYGG